MIGHHFPFCTQLLFIEVYEWVLRNCWGKPDKNAVGVGVKRLGVHILLWKLNQAPIIDGPWL